VEYAECRRLAAFILRGKTMHAALLEIPYFGRFGPERTGGGFPHSEPWVMPAFVIFVTLCAAFMYYQHNRGREQSPKPRRRKHRR
jgi:hypothetical protein